MHRVLSVKLSELNNYLKCPLCKGYLVDSYTINECLHSFCKSCIIKYIKRKECCPVCKIQIIKERMNVYLRRDVNLQCIVYKLVPDLFKNEMQKRRQFYSNHPKALKNLKKMNMLDKEAIGELEDEAVLGSDYQTEISLSIEYSETGLPEIFDSARTKELDPNAPKTYLLCPSSITINTLKKFLSSRFENKPIDQIEVMYDDKPLSPDFTLLDIAYIYAWRRTAPMRLFYRYTTKPPEPPATTDSSQVLSAIDNKMNHQTTPSESSSKRQTIDEADVKQQVVVDAVEIPNEKTNNSEVATADIIKPNLENQENNEGKLVVENEPMTKEEEEKSKQQIESSMTVEEANDAKVNSEAVNNNDEEDTKTISMVSTSINNTTNPHVNADSLTITAMVASIVQDSKKSTKSSSVSEPSQSPQTSTSPTSELETPQTGVATQSTEPTWTTSDKENESITSVMPAGSVVANNSSPSMATQLLQSKKLLNENTSMLNNDPNHSDTSAIKPSLTPNGTSQAVVKKPKLIKPKTEKRESVGAVGMVDGIEGVVKTEPGSAGGGRKKSAPRDSLGNVTKKPRLSKKQSSVGLKTESPVGDTTAGVKTNHVAPPITPNNTFNKLMPVIMNHLKSTSQQASEAQQQPQQQQSSTYSSWKPTYDYVNSPVAGDYNKPLPSLANSFINSKYVFDFLQTKAQHQQHTNYSNNNNQPYFGHHHQHQHHQHYHNVAAVALAAHQFQQQQQNQSFNHVAAAAAVAAARQRPTTPASTINPYEAAFRNPTPTPQQQQQQQSNQFLNPFASFFHDYQTSIFSAGQMFNAAAAVAAVGSQLNRSFGEKNAACGSSVNNDSSSSSSLASSGLDSLKETQLKISESCSLVNDLAS